MIKKIYRLNEKQVKKVLKSWKPFFSYQIVTNITKNELDFNRFAIIIWAKSVNTNITRNYFRRLFYDTVSQFIYKNPWRDLVFVVKKQCKLDKKDENSINSFKKDLWFLLKKTF